MWKKIKKWIYAINGIMMSIWIIFFQILVLVYDDGRTTIFNENHPFHFIFCITFLLGQFFLYIMHIMIINF